MSLAPDHSPTTRQPSLLYEMSEAISHLDLIESTKRSWSYDFNLFLFQKVDPGQALSLLERRVKPDIELVNTNYG